MMPILDAFQISLGIGEYDKFKASHGNVLGAFIGCNHNAIKLQVFKAINSEIMQCYHVRPISNEDNIPEVYQSSEDIEIQQTNIFDVAFILHVEELECGLFNLSGADNTYFI
jgi:hypothetical protein